ncbi:hypothetical protein P2318_20275 [Myxococcaceae bacterium GXIMD 01537]
MVGSSVLNRLLASGLCLLLLACGSTRHAVSGPTDARDLSRYVLLIERASNGQVVHAWKPLKDVDLSAHARLLHSRDAQERIVQVAFTRDCEQERDACEDMCRAGLNGPNWSHMRPGAKTAHCVRVCSQPYLDCNRLKEQAEREVVTFHAIDEAVDWAKRSSGKLLAGTVIVIAGVAFVVVVGASGGAVLLLAPAIVFASSDSATGPRALAVTP